MRVWDRFLTDNDKVYMRQTKPDQRVGFGVRPALLNIDLYRSVFGDKRMPIAEALKLWSGYCDSGWDALPHIQALLTAARAAGVPVFHATGLREEDSGIPSIRDAIHAGTPRRRAFADDAARDRHNRRYDIIDELAPISGEAIVRKATPRAFAGTPLSFELTRHGIDTLLIAGETTSGCVRASVLDAANSRLHVQIVEECVFDNMEASHALNLFDMHRKYADVTPLNTVLEYLRNLPPRPNSAAGQRT